MKLKIKSDKRKTNTAQSAAKIAHFPLYVLPL